MLEKEKKGTDGQNSVFPRRDSYQFVLKVNDTVVCQRYFKVFGFNKAALDSIELMDTLDYCVYLIKDDLFWKTYDYLFYAEPPTKIKLTGYRTQTQLPVNYPTYLEVERPDDYDFFNKPPKDGEVMLSFSFYIDGRLFYTTSWDGKIYPKTVRTNIDLTNTDRFAKASYDDLKFKEQMLKRFAEGKEDVVFKIVENLRDVLSKDKDYYTPLSEW